MFDSVIRSGAVVDRAILDKEVVVGPGAIVGDGPYDDRPNRQEPGRLNTGITVVGKRAVIPRGARIGRNVKVAADIRATDFAAQGHQERRVRRGRGRGKRRTHDRRPGRRHEHVAAAGEGASAPAAGGKRERAAG